jgi:hypothetical protein
MKAQILIIAMTGFLAWNALSQTASQWISQGQSALAAQDVVDANADFAQALALSPTNETANAFYATTRLLLLPSQPAGSNFLTRIGLPLPGRDIYDWTSMLPTDVNKVPLAPAGVDANEFTAQLRTNVLPTVSGAISNLAVITDNNFILNLSSSETSREAQTVDYGDLKLIQAELYGAEYVIYLLNAQNLNAQLTDLRTLYSSGKLTAGQVLADYPQLFTFATTNDLQAALAAFSNGVNAYMIASDFIRSRPAGETRLFNLDQATATDEGDFRLTLQDLENSLIIGPQWLAIEPNQAVDMSSQFTGETSWRSLLPKFDGNGIELGSFPDLTFGGLVYGLTAEQVEGGLSRYLAMLPVGATPELAPGKIVNLSFTTIPGHYYALQDSTNLTAWQTMLNFTATNLVTPLTDVLSSAGHFYRLRDDTGYFAFSGVVLDQNSGLPISGAEVQSEDDGATSYTDSNGQFNLVTTVSTDWFDDSLAISAVGYTTANEIFYPCGFYSGLYIYLSP